MIDQAQGLRVIVNKQNTQTKIITVTSGKGGVGKSSFALNMAIALNRKGRRALIIDTDFGFSNIDVMLGVNTKYDLLDVIKYKKDIRDIIEVGIDGVQFVSGGSGVYELAKLDTDQLMIIINNLLSLEDIADTIIFDTGAGISDNILRLIRASHETIIVTTPEPTSIIDAYSLIKIVCEHEKNPNLSLVLNKADSASEAAKVLDSLVRITKRYSNVDISKLGHILRDAHMVKAIKIQVPILESYPKCTASMNIDHLVDKFLNMPVKDNAKLGIKHFLDNFLQRNN